MRPSPTFFLTRAGALSYSRCNRFRLDRRGSGRIFDLFHTARTGPFQPGFLLSVPWKGIIRIGGFVNRKEDIC